MRILLLIVFAVGPCMALDPKITAELNARDAFLGDPVELTVKVHFDENWDFQPFELPETLGEATVLSHQWQQPELESETTLRQLVLRARVAWYKLGDATLPPMELVGEKGDGTGTTFKTPELHLTILAMLEEEDAEPAPAKGQVDLEVPPLWPYFLAAGLLLTLIIFLAYKFWPRKDRQVAVKAEPQIPPYEEALKRLNQLTHSSLLKEGKFKQFYVEMDLIIRHYYARLFSIHAEEMTQFEIEDWFAAQGNLPDGFLDQSRDFHERCGRVKFAKYDPVEAENRESVNLAYQLVETLKPKTEEVGNVAVG